MSPLSRLAASVPDFTGSLADARFPCVVNPMMLTSTWTGGKNIVDTWVTITEEAMANTPNMNIVQYYRQITGEVLSHKSS